MGKRSAVPDELFPKPGLLGSGLASRRGAGPGGSDTEASVLSAERLLPEAGGG